MVQKLKILNKILDSGVVAVIRAESADVAEKTTMAAVRGGIRAIEVTYTSPGATDLIKSLKESENLNDLVIGAGSVLDSETARIAILSGAEYIVSPAFDKQTAKLCNRYQIPYMPGCMTVTEMKTALEYGSDIVKLFPGNHFSPNMIRAFKGPLPQVSIMPTGGVTLQNVSEWIKSGAVAIGVGSDLSKPALAGDYDKVSKLASEYCKLVREARKHINNS